MQERVSSAIIMNFHIGLKPLSTRFKRLLVLLHNILNLFEGSKLWALRPQCPSFFLCFSYISFQTRSQQAIKVTQEPRLCCLVSIC